MLFAVPLRPAGLWKICYRKYINMVWGYFTNNNPKKMSEHTPQGRQMPVGRNVPVRLWWYTVYNMEQRWVRLVWFSLLGSQTGNNEFHYSLCCQWKNYDLEFFSFALSLVPSHADTHTPLEHSLGQIIFRRIFCCWYFFLMFYFI